MLKLKVHECVHKFNVTSDLPPQLFLLGLPLHCLAPEKHKLPFLRVTWMCLFTPAADSENVTVPWAAVWMLRGT